MRDPLQLGRDLLTLLLACLLLAWPRVRQFDPPAGDRLLVLGVVTMLLTLPVVLLQGVQRLRRGVAALALVLLLGSLGVEGFAGSQERRFRARCQELASEVGGGNVFASEPRWWPYEHLELRCFFGHVYDVVE